MQGCRKEGKLHWIKDGERGCCTSSHPSLGREMGKSRDIGQFENKRGVKGSCKSGHEGPPRLQPPQALALLLRGQRMGETELLS